LSARETSPIRAPVRPKSC